MLYKTQHATPISYDRFKALSVPFALTIHTLSACHQPVSASAADWFIKSHAKCYRVYVIKNP